MASPGKSLRIIIYFVAVISIQEITFRYFFPLPEISNFNRSQFIPAPPEITWPSYRYERRTFHSAPDTNHAFVHTLNGYGFRDRDWAIIKNSNEKRVMFIGDSFLEGAMAEDDQTITHVFEGMADGQIETMNLGIIGAGLPEYTRLVNAAVPIFKPDQMVLVLFSNDISNRHVSRPERFEGAIRFSNYKPRLLQIISNLLRGEGQAWRWRKAKGFMPPVPHPNNLWTHQADVFAQHVTPEIADVMKAGLYNTFRINYLAAEEKHLKTELDLKPWLGWLQKFLSQHQAELVICYIPSRNQVTKYYYPFEKVSCLKLCPDSVDLTTERYHIHAQSLQLHCDSLQIPFLDLTNQVRRKEALGEHLYWNYDDHMRAKGYRFIASEIYHWYTTIQNDRY